MTLTTIVGLLNKKSNKFKEVTEQNDGCQAMVDIGSPAGAVGVQIGGTGCADRQV
jgi:hypothetical protein